MDGPPSRAGLKANAGVEADTQVASLGLGEPLASDTRAFFEPRFGFDFGRVRVHADRAAAASARRTGAAAYTLGSHIAFAAGRYAPSSHAGQALLAHELAHVVQQTAVPRAGPTQSRPHQVMRTPAPEPAARAALVQRLQHPDPQTSLPLSIDALSSARFVAADEYTVTVEGQDIELNELQYSNWMGAVRGAAREALNMSAGHLAQVEATWSGILDVNERYWPLDTVITSWFRTEAPSEALAPLLAAARLSLRDANEAFLRKDFAAMLTHLEDADEVISDGANLVRQYAEELGANAESLARAATVARHASLGVLIGLGAVLLAPEIAVVSGGAALVQGLAVIGTGATAGATVEGSVNLVDQGIRGEGIDDAKFHESLRAGWALGTEAATGGVVGTAVAARLGMAAVEQTGAAALRSAVARGMGTGAASGSTAAAAGAAVRRESPTDIAKAGALGGIEGLVGGAFGGVGQLAGDGMGTAGRLAATATADALGNTLGGMAVGKSLEEVALSAALGVTTGTALEMGAAEGARASRAAAVETRTASNAHRALPQTNIAVVPLTPSTMLQLGFADGDVAIRFDPDGSVRDVVHTPNATRIDVDVHIAYARRLQTWLFETRLWLEGLIQRLRGAKLSRIELDRALRELHKREALLDAYWTALTTVPLRTGEAAALIQRTTEVEMWKAHWESVLRSEEEPEALDTSVIFGRRRRPPGQTSEADAPAGEALAAEVARPEMTQETIAALQESLLSNLPTELPHATRIGDGLYECRRADGKVLEVLDGLGEVTRTEEVVKPSEQDAPWATPGGRITYSVKLPGGTSVEVIDDGPRRAVANDFRIEEVALMPASEAEPAQWVIKVSAEIEGTPVKLGEAYIYVGPDNKPLDRMHNLSDGQKLAKPDIWVDNRVTVNGEKVKGSFPAGSYSLTTRTLYALIDVYKEKFSHEPIDLGSQLYKENLRNFRKQYAKSVADRAMTPELAQQAAAKAISLGKSRLEIGYSVLTVRTEGETYAVLSREALFGPGSERGYMRSWLTHYHYRHEIRADEDIILVRVPENVFVNARRPTP